VAVEVTAGASTSAACRLAQRGATCRRGVPSEVRYGCLRVRVYMCVRVCGVRALSMVSLGSNPFWSTRRWEVKSWAWMVSPHHLQPTPNLPSHQEYRDQQQMWVWWGMEW